MAEVMPPVVQAQVVESQGLPGPARPGRRAGSQCGGKTPVHGGRRGGWRQRQVHYLIAFGIAVPIIVLIVL